MIFPAHKIFKNYCVSSIHFNFRFIKVTLEKNLRRRRKLFHIMFIRCCKFLVLYKIKMTRFSFLISYKMKYKYIYPSIYIEPTTLLPESYFYTQNIHIFHFSWIFFIFFLRNVFSKKRKKQTIQKWKIPYKEKREKEKTAYLQYNVTNWEVQVWFWFWALPVRLINRNAIFV